MGMQAFQIVALISTAVATGVQVYGQIQAGKAAKQAGETQAEIAENAGRQASDESRERQRRMRTRNAARMSAYRSKMGASGIDPGSGSSLDFLATSAQRLELAVLDEAYRGTAQQRVAGNRANLSIWEGNQQQRAQNNRAYGTLLTGIAQTSGQAAEWGTFSPSGNGAGAA